MIYSSTFDDRHLEAGVLGVGNLLLRDEGFGVHLIRHLESRYVFPDTVRLVDGGTSGIFLSPFFEKTNKVLTVDIIKSDEPPGTILRFTQDELKARSAQLRMSPHQIGVLEILEICKLRGRAPEHVDFLGVVPLDLSTGIGLSTVLEERLPVVAAMVLDYLDDLGLRATVQKDHRVCTS
ncbi:HyaD/HybD family hydrogenase maturation endopeptidase [Dissulfurimicrobium hydrothermale]|uniref:HyaD/HybD family hydrogenase maturation endopeptidase n=1 Tax=Dissulfurimicrobium hydrothermale TaxID=1750598 RepID=UPI001EDB7447|nr:HyaD/HybD family hydrogenase maturation endopeptidase [Dissulfurimicrobium hydrothermale]UKL13590.1 HyaD/HybD family hydrogenase maturation endopeptidase [Dissulfurimicrobium hydrothermale]